MNLSEEPDESDPNTCHIKFRIPSGEKNIERRFLKTDKIDILFRFLKVKVQKYLQNLILMILLSYLWAFQEKT